MKFHRQLRRSNGISGSISFITLVLAKFSAGGAPSATSYLSSSIVLRPAWLRSLTLKCLHAPRRFLRCHAPTDHLRKWCRFPCSLKRYFHIYASKFIDEEIVALRGNSLEAYEAYFHHLSLSVATLSSIFWLAWRREPAPLGIDA